MKSHKGEKFMSGLTGNKSYRKVIDLYVSSDFYHLLGMSLTWSKRDAQIYLRLPEQEINEIWKEAMKIENNCKANFSNKLVYREKFLEFIKNYKKINKKEKDYER